MSRLKHPSRREFMSAAAVTGIAFATPWARGAVSRRPNILFAIADDWSWPHASIGGTGEVHTPAFDRVAREGCLFTNCITAAPQCSPNRAAILTGRHIWQLAEAGTHASIFPRTHPVYPDLLAANGYHVGYTGKGWGPGDWQRGGWTQNPAGREYNEKRFDAVPVDGIINHDYAGNFETFLAARPEGAPFCFWYGGKEPHRKYEVGSGRRAGKDAAKVRVPAYLPDDPAVRNDFLDYFLEIEWFDSQLGTMLSTLEQMGELDNTLVIVTGDNGMSFPRAKANVYEHGVHVPLAMRWPGRIDAGRTEASLVSCVDFAPTFLAAAGLSIPESVTGKSLSPLFGAGGDSANEFVLTGRERHTHARFDNWGYPSRAIRTQDHLYIWNLKPDRWPAGDPDGYHDIDAAPSKSVLTDNPDKYAKYFELSLGKRPEEELYAVDRDGDCMNNLAADPAHADVKAALRAALEKALKEQGDPRMRGSEVFDSYPRVSEMRPELGGFAARGEYNPKYGAPE
ncbi:MAG: hypothetical protein AMXMBFR84_26920 [Candidatus Hydrogenedentota bacterium]